MVSTMTVKIMKSYRVALLLCAFPAALLAQVAETGSISGVVRDASGKAIPGATITAASPALIQGSLSTTTDSNGAYRILELRPGTYSVNFTALGFSTIRRDGLVLTAGFNATESAEMQVGAVTQTGLESHYQLSPNPDCRSSVGCWRL